MKRVFSFLILLAVLFLGLEFIVTLFTKEYKDSYSLFLNNKEFKINENYSKEMGDIYDIEITVGDNTFYYVIDNNFNKQKRIVKDVVYYEDNNDVCIYPILKDDSGSYIECVKDNVLYVKNSFPNHNLINLISSDLDNRGYKLDYHEDYIDKYGNSIVYQKNINENDLIILWNYKGINMFDNRDIKGHNVINFDKYDNKLGTLVGKYYVAPRYENERLFEFNKVEVIDLETNKSETITLKDITLSSSTYVNGIVNGKLYYTDPYNLLQVEIGVSNKFSRLIGSVDLGGQMYDGEKWTNRNIYDFKQEIKYGKSVSLENYPNSMIYEGKGVYYVYENNNMYQVPKNHLDKKVLLFNGSVNNIYVVDNDLYYVFGDTLYWYSSSKQFVRILVDKDLLYNTNNRISVYRKNS